MITKRRLDQRLLSYLARLAVVGALTASATGCAWYPKSMDDEILQLQDRLDTRRNDLSQSATPYRAEPGQHFQVEVSARPVKETVEKFDSSQLPRTMTIISTNADGNIWEGWTNCPWPLSGHLGVSVNLFPTRGGMAAAVYLQGFKYRGWSAAQGPLLEFSSVFTGGYMIILGELEYCFGKIPVAAFPVGIVGTNFGSSGAGAYLSTDADGIEYKFRLLDPLSFLGVIYVAGWTIPVPFRATPDLFGGRISNILGKEGNIQLVHNGVVRKYVIGAKFNGQRYLDNGLTAFGIFKIDWQ